MVEWGPDEVKPSVDALGAACDLLEAIDTISIAAVNGFALGGGMEVALAADLRYLADDATVGQPEIRLGVIPGAGGTQRLTRLVGPGRARELVYTGRQVAAEEALALGLAERVVPADEVLEAAIADARALANGPRQALAAAKAAIRAATETPGRGGCRAGARALPGALRHLRPARGHARVPGEARPLVLSPRSRDLAPFRTTEAMHVTRGHDPE